MTYPIIVDFCEIKDDKDRNTTDIINESNVRVASLQGANRTDSEIREFVDQINAAYEQGVEDGEYKVQEAIKEALGVT